MLVLSRHAYTPETPESVLIGDDIQIQVLEIRGGSVRLGIVAPPHIKITRSELLVEAEDFQTEDRSAPTLKAA